MSGLSKAHRCVSAAQRVAGRQFSAQRNPPSDQSETDLVSESRAVGRGRDVPRGPLAVRLRELRPAEKGLAAANSLDPDQPRSIVLMKGGSPEQVAADAIALGRYGQVEILRCRLTVHFPGSEIALLESQNVESLEAVGCPAVRDQTFPQCKGYVGMTMDLE